MESIKDMELTTYEQAAKVKFVFTAITSKMGYTFFSNTFSQQVTLNIVPYSYNSFAFQCDDRYLVFPYESPEQTVVSPSALYIDDFGI